MTGDAKTSFLAEVVIATLMIAFSSFILVQVVMTDVVFWREGRGVGGGFLPTLFCGALFVLGAISLVKAVRNRAAVTGEADDEAPVSRKKLWSITVILLLTPLFMMFIGALPTIALMVIAIQRFNEHMRWWVSVVAGIAVAAASWYLFEILLGLPLPTGVFGGPF